MVLWVKVSRDRHLSQREEKQYRKYTNGTADLCRRIRIELGTSRRVI